MYQRRVECGLHAASSFDGVKTNQGTSIVMSPKAQLGVEARSQQRHAMDERQGGQATAFRRVSYRAGASV